MMQYKTKLAEDKRQERRQVYEEIRDAFAEKYSFLGAQASREMLMSAASWNIDEYSDPPMRFRNHVMLTWEPGWVKSTIIRKMADVLGEDMVKTVGKVTAAVMRGSVSGGKFSPPAPLKAPIVASTEFGQTTFEDELLNTFLALLEEGQTNVSLNKIAGMSESLKSNVKQKYDGQVEFKEDNEFDLQVNTVFWGATHDPTLLAENALKSRFNVVTPAKPLTGEVTEALDNATSIHRMLDKTTIRDVRRMLKEDKEVATNFKPPSSFYKEYSLSPRESRDVQAYMASRNWWGLEVNPGIMKEYIEQLKHSRRIADMTPHQRVKSIIFDNPKTYEEIMNETGLTKLEVYDIIEDINACRAGSDLNNTKWVVRSGESFESEDKGKEEWLSDG